MSVSPQDVSDELHRRSIQSSAAKIETAPLLKNGWRIVFFGWAAPILPVIGIPFLGLFAFVGIVIGIVALVKGNTGGGLKLALIAWLGSAVVGGIWFLLYSLMGLSLLK